MKKLLLIGMATITSTTFAQSPLETIEMPDVIVQGNRLQTKFSESTRDIQIITQKEIAKLPVQTINELLNYVAGVDIRQRGPFGAQADVRIDGGSFEETLVLLDGIKLINSQTGHNMMNLPLTLGAIDHIEVLRGAAARVYGINALTGAINIVTRKQKNSFVSANIYAGSTFQNKVKDDGKGKYGGGAAEITANYGSDRQSHLISVGQNISNGERYNSAIKNTKGFYRGSFQPNADNEINALAGYIYNRFGANGYYAAPGDINSEEIIETAVFSLSSTHKFGNFSLSPRLSNRYDEDDYRYFKDTLSKARSLHYTNALMAELNTSLITNIGDFGVGGEARFETINSTNIGKHKRDNYGGFAEYKGFFWNRLRTNIGLYANYSTDYGWQVYPGVDAAFNIDRHWQVAANVGSGQRIPSYTDLYLNQKPGNVGNPDVRPESSWQYEGKIKYAQANFEMQAGAFYRNISAFIDWIRADDSQPYSPVNFGNNKVLGLYARVFGKLAQTDISEFGYRLSYNYLKPGITENDGAQSKYILESLKHQFMLGINYQYRKFGLHVENRFIKRELNKAYDILDARLSYAFKSVQIYSDINNVLNARYMEMGAVPTSPRGYILGAKFYLVNN